MTFKAGTAAKYVGEWWRRGDLLVSPCARTKASRLALLPERVGEWWKKDWSADSAFWPKADPARFLQIHSEIDLLVMPLPVQKLQGTPARTCWERAGSAVSAFWQKADPVRFLQIQPEIDAYIGGFWSGEIFLDPGREFYKARTPFVY
jgi:hypothetical protein